MRFQDWDILLFPDGSHVPIQEFRTACFLVQDGSLQTPTLITYVPSLPRGTPFNISLHSWTQPRFSPGLGLFYGRKNLENAAWGVRIIVDGECVSSSTFASTTTFPQIMSTSDRVQVNGKPKPLVFPRFHRTVLSRRDWDIADDLGRIKVLIMEGYHIPNDLETRFQPVRTVACFSFHAAPMDYLERCNIAWPNPAMYAYPWRPSMTELPKLGQPSTVSPQHTQYHTLYTGSYETPLRSYPPPDSGFYTGSSTMPPPPLPSHLSLTNSLAHPFPDMESLCSRSASGNSTLFDAGNPNDPLHRLASAADAQARQSRFRLPSDQLRQIISALKVNKREPDDITNQVAPVTPHVHRAAENAGSRHLETGDDTFKSTRPSSHHQRNATDASMHLACTGFPDCTSDDPESGDVVHTTPLKLNTRVLDRDDSGSLSSVDEDALRMFAPDELRTDVVTRKILSSPVREAKKRTRSAFAAHDANARESPQRKISKGSARGFGGSVAPTKENELSIA